MTTELDFRYCPLCKGHLQKTTANLLICENCNFHYYSNPRPTNAIILKNSLGKILMVKRKHNPQKGKWDLAGGFIDPLETLEESVTREVKEELGIEVIEFSYVSSFHDPYEFGGVTFQTVCSLFEGLLPENANIIPSDDAESVEFFKPEEIPYNDMAFAGMVAALKKYFAEKN